MDGSIPARVRGWTAPETSTRPSTRRDPPGNGSAAAIAIFEDWLVKRLPDGMDAEGLLLNRICADIESTPGIARVAQLCERWQVGERSLQRLVRTRMGITPKWLLQRHRLQEAAALMGRGTGPTWQLAHGLGYADQAHFTRDFTGRHRDEPGRIRAPGPGRRFRRLTGDVPPIPCPWR